MQGSIVATIYAVAGGLEAVIWTDLLQTFAMFVACNHLLADLDPQAVWRVCTNPHGNRLRSQEKRTTRGKPPVQAASPQELLRVA